MEINNSYERIIDLRDLFFHILYRWRSILIAAVIGALALAAIQHFTIQNVHKDGGKTTEEMQYEIDLQNYRGSLRNARNNIKTYTQLIKERNDYLDDSIYMQLDPQNIWVGTKRFYVQMDTSALQGQPEFTTQDLADSVTPFYVQAALSQLDPTEMEELMGTSRKEYINELVDISTNFDMNTILVRIVGSDSDVVAKQMDYFVNRMLTDGAERAQTVGKHQLILVNEDMVLQSDSDLSAKQEATNKKLGEWQLALQENRQLLNALEQQDEPKAPGEHLVRYAVIGWLVGAVLVAGIYLVRYATRGRLHTGRELADHYGLSSFGQLCHSRARRPGKGIDRWIEKWEFKRAQTDREAILDGAAALLRERCADKRVVLAGTVTADKLAPVAEGLRARLGDAVRLDTQPDFLNDSGAIAAADGADAVLLVEEKEVSHTSDIGREVEMLGIGRAAVEGFFLI